MLFGSIKNWFKYGIILSMKSMFISLTSFAMASLDFFKNNSLDVTVNLLRIKFALSIHCKTSISPDRKECTSKNTFLWKFLTDKIEKTKEIVYSLRSGDVDILQNWKFQPSFKLKVTSNEWFLNKFSEDTANDFKLIYIDIIDKMIPYFWRKNCKSSNWAKQRSRGARIWNFQVHWETSGHPSIWFNFSHQYRQI